MRKTIVRIFAIIRGLQSDDYEGKKEEGKKKERGIKMTRKKGRGRDGGGRKGGQSISIMADGFLKWWQEIPTTILRVGSPKIEGEPHRGKGPWLASEVSPGISQKQNLGLFVMVPAHSRPCLLVGVHCLYSWEISSWWECIRRVVCISWGFWEITECVEETCTSKWLE